MTMNMRADVETTRGPGQGRGQTALKYLDVAPPKAAKGEGAPILRHLKKETGAGTVTMDLVKKRHAGDALRQIDEFFDRFEIPAATGRKRTASRKTELAYRVRLTAVVKRLRQLNMPIQNLNEMSIRQVRAAFLSYEKEGAAASWMANLNTVVRRFNIWIGKPDVCPPL